MVARVKALAEALEGSDVNEIEVTESGTKISIRRRQPDPPPVQGTGQTPAASRRVVTQSARPVGAGRSTTQPSPPDPTVAILAPLTGVYYSSPSPSSAPFVEVGGTVQAGQVVCIIEAMKVFNELKAEVSGTVTTLLAKNGQLVQKNDALMRVKPI
ncbi:MAG: acetyl-CoA carboxylase biotin carboxyl carrier protein [Ktedonobacterales bacterium]